MRMNICVSIYLDKKKKQMFFKDALNRDVIYLTNILLTLQLLAVITKHLHINLTCSLIKNV